MSVSVQRGELQRVVVGVSQQQFGLDECVNETDVQRRIRREDLSEIHCTPESCRCESGAADGDGRSGHREPERHLVGRELVGRALDSDAVVAGKQQERSHGDGMPATRDDHWSPEGEDPVGQLEARTEHGRGCASAAGEDLQIETCREDTLPAGQHHDRVVGLSSVEGEVEVDKHLGRERIDLPVVHRDRGDAGRELVGDFTAMNHALEHIERAERATWSDPTNGTEEERQELYRQRSDYLRDCVFGVDLNPGLVRAAKMNMVMNNDGSGGLFQADSLANPHVWDPKLSSAVPLGSIDVLVTNPPFGANITIDDEALLSQYDLAAVWDRDDDGQWAIRTDRHGARVLQKSQPPEILFIERCVQLVAEGSGRLAMVIPNGILNNPALGYVRQWLQQQVQILAVVDMARELFQPKNDTRTSMVLMRRLDGKERALASAGKLEYPIFMAIAERVGHDKRGNTLWRRTETGEDVVVKRTETVTEIDPGTGEEVLVNVEVADRLVDDELPDVARAYLQWVTEQS